MQKPSWQLTEALDAVILDCDGTLSRLEGIDELATENGVGEEVHRLTEEAMSETGITLNLYENRINLVKPNHDQLVKLGERYFLTRSSDANAVIDIFKRLGKTVYIISAGLNPSVKIFAESLGIAEEFVYAVDVIFDDQGNYVDFDRDALPAHHQGKQKIVQQIKTKVSHILHVGDGMNDYEAHDEVDRFIGYGGVSYRQHIAELCDYYIKSASLSPLLPLGLTALEIENLTSAERSLYDQGVDYINEGGVIIRPQPRHPEQTAT